VCAAALRALAAVPTLTALHPDGLALEATDLPLLLPLPQLRSLHWRKSGVLLSEEQFSPQTLRLCVSGLTTLHFCDERLSEDDLTQLLTPLRQLQELRLYQTMALSGAFLQAGSLPSTLRTRFSPTCMATPVAVRPSRQARR